MLRFTFYLTLLVPLPALVPAAFGQATSGTAPLLYELASPNAEAAGRFGHALAAVGDLDGDGVSDFLVGADNEDRQAGGRGRSYAFSGATGELIFSLELPSGDGDLGSSVAPAGDLDGDGVGDLLVGVPDGDEERAFAFSGTDGELLLTLAAPSQDDFWFGQAVAGVGDVSGDGVSDLLVGAPFTDYVFEGQDLQNAGRAYLFSGATGGLLRTFQSAVPTRNGFFGEAVAAPGDLDGDGAPDLLVGAPYDDSGPDEFDEVGAFYAFSGATGALLYGRTNDLAPTNLSAFGSTLASAGDLDGDGVSDVLVGAPEEVPLGGANWAGRVYVFSGASGSLLRTLTSPLMEVGEDAFFGSAVGAAGDLDGDGVGDLLVGAEAEDGGAEQAGRAYAFSGSSGAALLVLESPDPTELGFFGWSVAGLGDVSGDGVPDLAIGAPLEDVDGVMNAGRVYVFGGAPVASEEAPAPAAGLSVSAHPNPAQGPATVTLALRESAETRVTVHDVLGRAVQRLHGGALAAGVHRLGVDTSLLAPGLYLVRAATAEGTATTRLLVLR